MKIGAKAIDLDKVQVHPTSFVDPIDPTKKVNFLAPEALRGHGGILLNNQGARFSNELGPRDYVTEQIFQHCDTYKLTGLKVAYLLLDEQAANDFGFGALGFYMKKGLFTKVNVDELAKLIGCVSQSIRETIDDYNKIAIGKNSDRYGKTVFPRKIVGETFYVAIITPAIHYTMGGLKINSVSEVQYESIDEYGDSVLKPIVGLYAAGEVTGGVHGKNRLAGNSLLECVVFGRIAGKRAAFINNGTSKL
jgi:succinate dehydrogenase/fumarate reductase flavoprotein subunit